MSAMEKSDLPIVARKRANKAASAAAEPVERRAGPRRMRNCKARSGLRAGKPRHRRRPAYEKPSSGKYGRPYRDRQSHNYPWRFHRR